MPNGKPGDHPPTDILVHKMKVYGQEADDIIRKIAELSSRRELNEWWEREIGWSPDNDSVVRKARTRFDELLRRAKQSGWEMMHDHIGLQRHGSEIVGTFPAGWS